MDSRRLQNELDAQVGIGTMIVFIATVLVAAIAAGVLITTSSDLQEKSARTGKEATEQVSSNLQVEAVIGTRPNQVDGIQTIDVYLSLAPGAADVDLSQMVVQISDGATLATLSYTSGATSASLYAAVEERDADGGFTTSTPVMSPGDLVYLDIWASAALAGDDVDEREDIKIVLIPEVGNSVPIGFRTPNSWAGDLIIDLV